MSKDVVTKLETMGVIPVVALDEAKTAVSLGEALLAGGLPCAELTFRTEAAADAIHTMSQAYPEMLIGAGTVLTIEQAKLAVEAGAQYLLAPGCDPDLLNYCHENNILMIPGVMTPTDVTMAVKKGASLLKFFPAGVMGQAALKAISDPFVGVEFVPTGGINAGNLADFLRMPNVKACGGSWLVKKQLIQNGRFSDITKLTKEAVAIVKEVRGG